MNALPLTVFTQINFVAEFLQAKCDFILKTTFSIFSFFGGLGATYGDYFRLIIKRVGDLLLMLIELFPSMLRLNRYEQISVQNRVF